MDWLIKELNDLRSSIIDGGDGSQFDIVGLIGESIERMTSLDLQRKLSRLKELEDEIAEGRRPLLPFKPGDYFYSAYWNGYSYNMSIAYEPYIPTPISEWDTNGGSKACATLEEAEDFLRAQYNEWKTKFPDLHKEFSYEKLGFE